MITFTLPYPPSVNHLYATVRGRRIKSREGKAFDQLAAYQLALQHVRGISGRVKVRYEVGRPKTPARRDVANLEKALSDALVSNGVIQDDSLIEQLTIGWTDGVDGVRVTVEAA